VREGNGTEELREQQEVIMLESEKIEDVVVDEIKAILRESGIDGEVLTIDLQKAEVEVIPEEDLWPPHH
jgi:hypothetical protein